MIFRPLLRWTLLSLLILLLLLSGGQIFKLRDLLQGGDLLPVLFLGMALLLEVALPLSALLSTGILYSRLRQDRALTALNSLGLRPAQYRAPALLLGLLLGGLALLMTQTLSPALVQALRGELERSAGPALLRAGAWPQMISSEQEIWLKSPSPQGPPRILHLAKPRLSLKEGAWLLESSAAQLWGPQLRLRVGSCRLHLSAEKLFKRLGSLGPPNSTWSEDLPQDAHGRFTWHRRWSLPLMAPLWALFGAWLGGRLKPLQALLLGSAALALAYWILRIGELNARAGFSSPLWAAWAPALLLLLTLTWLAQRSP